MLELVVSEVPAIEKIKSNLVELKEVIKPQLEEYKLTVYTEDTIKEAKEDRAKLNKLEKAINDKKIEITKLFNKPLEEYISESKETSALIKEAVSAIDKQVKDFEQKQKDKKLLEINEFFKESAGELAKVLKFDNIYNEKWLNTTYKMKDIEDEIKQHISNTETDLKVITDLKSEFELQLKDFYLKTLNLTETLAEKTRLEEQKKKLMELDKVVIPKANIPNVIPTGIAPPKEQDGDPTEYKEYTFRVWLNKEQIQAMNSLFKGYNVKYEMLGGSE